MSDLDELPDWFAEADRNERPFATLGTALPPADLDIAALSPVVAPPGPAEPRDSRDLDKRSRNLARAFAGRPGAAHLNALLICVLRRRDPPTHAAPLFNRLWDEAADVLLAALPARWLVSAAQTFRDHGRTPERRLVGAELTVMAAMVKLYETERLHSNRAPTEPFARRRQEARIALDMDPFAIRRGDLHRALMVRLLRGAGDDPVAQALARALGLALLDDRRAVFRRLRAMRDARAAPDA